MKRLLISMLLVGSLFLMQGDGVGAINGFVLTNVKLCEPGKSWKDGGYEINLPPSQMAQARRGLISVCRSDLRPNDKVKISYLTDKVANIGRQVAFCLGDYYAALDSNGNIIPAGKAIVVNPVCCPSSHPYINDHIFADLFNSCRDKPNDNGDVSSGINSIVSTLSTVNPDKWGMTSGYFEDANLQSFICNNGCVVDSNRMIAKGDLYNTPVTADQINNAGVTCVPNYAVGNSPSEGFQSILSPSACKSIGSGSAVCICYDNAAYDKKLFEDVGPAGINFLLQCAGLPEDQSQQCVTCLSKNFFEEKGVIVNETYFTFSSALGCIDTRTGGIVNRLLQIGLGIGSGIAILRIIQAAYLRQTNDPGKIQEGNEIMVSTFIAIAVMVGAVVMLEIIGVNVLNIFTPEGFASILNQ